MGAAGRRIAEREYTCRVQAERYSSLYRSLLGDTAAGVPKETAERF